jgi:uncharacterized membrane protein YqaE (UPF0057 family)
VRNLFNNDLNAAITIPRTLLVDNKILLIILAIILPPLAVFLKKNVGTELIISIVLSLFFYIPGILYALYIVTKK